jgi:ketosteroid isomerase-like protein
MAKRRGIVGVAQMKMNRRNIAAVGLAVAGAAALPVAMSSVASACDTDDILKAVETYKKAMIDADGARLLEMSSDAMSFGHANGVVQSKVEFVKSVVDKAEIFKSIKLYDHDIKTNGDQSIARHTFEASIFFQGKDIDLTLSIVQVWRKEDGKWRLFTRQSFKPITV